ncbi:MAG: DUF3299 domain-containing protein [Shimia sp.]|uniref:DUF3299 domain-containing protein n=1 Tax=Shimia sp. TaxID=1954381 RepID=UPI004059CA99
MKSYVLSAALLLVAPFAMAADPLSVGWDELAPPFTTYENPFEDLSSHQMNKLAHLLQLRTLADTGTDATASEDAEMLAAEMEAEGLDVEWLFAERERIIAHRTREATDPNKDVVGKNIRIPGYLLPLEVKDGKATEFLLVPTVGACIHTPPPPANQIVLVSYPQGFEAGGLYTPIWISGTIKSDPGERSLYLVDGNLDVNITYTMTAGLVENYTN